MKIWHPYTQEATDMPPITIERGEGAYLYASDGRRFIDAISSWWVNLHGHGHPLIAEAIAKQTRTLEQVIFAGFTHEPAEALAACLTSIAPPELTRVFYSDNGSTAVEVAIKMAVQYWHNSGHPEKRKIIALENAYHGDTIGAMSMSADSPFTAAFGALRIPVLRVADGAQLARILEERGNEVAAMIVEPLIQGAGGMLIYPAEQLQEFHRLCALHDALFIADEVFTGFGRTGRMFACEHAGIVPDLMCLAKGLTGGFLPLAVTLCREKIYRAFYSNDRTKAFFHGHSYSANLLACAAATANLRIFETEPVFDRIANIESIHKDRLSALRTHPAVAGTRMLGSIAALDVRTQDPGYLSNLRSRLYSFFIDNHVLLRPLGNVVCMVPPYVISAADLHHTYDVIAGALDACGT